MCTVNACMSTQVAPLGNYIQPTSLFCAGYVYLCCMQDDYERRLQAEEVEM